VVVPVANLLGLALRRWLVDEARDRRRTYRARARLGALAAGKLRVRCRVKFRAGEYEQGGREGR